VVCGGVGVTGRVTAEERAALPVARAALVGRASAYGPADAIVFALGGAGLLQSPETAAELEQLRARVTELETGRVLPWAAAMSDDDLHHFLGDLLSAAMGRWRSEPEVPDRVTLAAIETACADWRTPGQGCRGDDPEAGESR
jgi:hypothetical protein